MGSPPQLGAAWGNLIPQKMWITLWKKSRVDHISSGKTGVYSNLHLFRSVLSLLKSSKQLLRRTHSLCA